MAFPDPFNRSAAPVSFIELTIAPRLFFQIGERASQPGGTGRYEAAQLLTDLAIVLSPGIRSQIVDAVVAGQAESFYGNYKIRITA